VGDIQRTFGASLNAMAGEVRLETLQRAIDWHLAFVVPDGAIIVAAFAAGLVPELTEGERGRVAFTGSFLRVAGGARS
jgi:hypothetical protein